MASTKKKTVGTVADAIPTSITVSMLTSKRMWTWLITNVVKFIFLVLGFDITDDMTVKMTDNAMIYGAAAAQFIELAGLLYTKYLDEKKK